MRLELPSKPTVLDFVSFVYIFVNIFKIAGGETHLSFTFIFTIVVYLLVRLVNFDTEK